MTDKVVILVTAPSRVESRRIGRRLVEARLAACVSITGPVQSLYRWKGKMADDKEFMLFIKSTRGLFPRIRREISKVHSYQTPEIICLPIVEGSEDYLKWVEESVVKATESI